MYIDAHCTKCKKNAHCTKYGYACTFTARNVPNLCFTIELKCT